MLFKIALKSLVFFSCLPLVVLAQEPSQNEKSEGSIEEVLVWGKALNSSQAGYTNPTSVLNPEDFTAINIATTEDVVKFEPSIVIRRRYIGDSNGTLGLRGSNMFQTSRSMVFADGVPLHYLLQSRWSGAPRWTMVSASEIAQTEIIYGPFSAEYSGNAMGGVINIETAIPQEREFHADASYFAQSFDAYGFNDTVTGNKSFFSYGDKIGDVSLYLSYNRLENESQPQSFYLDGNGNSPLTSASGSVIDEDTQGENRHYFADSGIENAFTQNYKMKIGYEMGKWLALLNIAYEDRTTTRDSATPYIRDSAGDLVYSGLVALDDGSDVNVLGRRLSVSELERDSLNTGLRLKGPLANNILLEANVNQFDVLQDETAASALNPNDPLFTTEGIVTDYDNTGWRTADAKVIFSELGIEGLEIVTGLKTEAYQLGIDVYQSDNYVANSKSSISNRSGGETEINAAFVQMNWDINSDWDAALGGRYEKWKSKNGYYSEGSGAGLTLVALPKREESKFSPKFSVAYHGLEQWTLRYSIAQAFRFPIVEELYDRQRRFNSASIADPGLAPEDGFHQNLMLDYHLDDGYLRLNVFHETIDDAIDSFTDSQTGLRTFNSMGSVETTGVEFVANVYGFLSEGLSLRFNATFTDSEIVDNPGDTSLEGNDLPRMPKWRSNLMASYRIQENWQAAFNVQYADDSYGNLNNTELVENVFGAQDGYTRIGLTSHYDINQSLRLGVGVDNLTDEIAYVHHPWPGRTLYGNISYDF